MFILKCSPETLFSQTSVSLLNVWQADEASVDGANVGSYSFNKTFSLHYVIMSSFGQLP